MTDEAWLDEYEALLEEVHDAYLRHPSSIIAGREAAATVLHDRINDSVEARLAEVRAECERLHTLAKANNDFTRMKTKELADRDRTIAEQRDQLKDARHAMAKQSATIAEQAAVIERKDEAMFDVVKLAYIEGATAVHRFLFDDPEARPDFAEAAGDYARAALQKDQTNG